MNEIKYAGFWIRFAASLIDSLIIGVIVLPLLIYIYGVNYLFSTQLVKGFWDVILQFVLPAAAIVLLWIYRSATPGKDIADIEIVDAQTLQKPSPKQCLIRYLAYYPGLLCLGAGFVMIGFDAKKRGWHDRMANTLVTYKQPRPSSSKPH